jgi:hypothetical protein
MSHEMVAILITLGSVALLVLWIPAMYLTRHCFKTLFHRQQHEELSSVDARVDTLTAYLLSGTRHEQE